MADQSLRREVASIAGHGSTQKGLPSKNALGVTVNPIYFLTFLRFGLPGNVNFGLGWVVFS